MSEDERYSQGDSHSTMQFAPVIHPDLARFFTDFEDVIDSLRMSWEGKDVDYQYDPPKLVDTGEPLMNSKGIGKLTSLLKAVCHKGIPMANFDPTRPYVFARKIGLIVAENIFVNFDNYDIKSIDDANQIIFGITMTFFATATRPVSEGERKFIKGYTKESHVIGPEKKRRFSL